MYLDANGDGIHTPADIVSSSGVTLVDVWIKTDSARDGTPASCSAADSSLTIRSYLVVLHAQDGTVTWGPFVNRQQEAMPFNIASAFDTTDAFVFYDGSNPLPPGTYKLGSTSVSVATGTPSLIITTESPLSGGYPTAFGSSCPGMDFDNSLKLGPNALGPGDWFDVDGLAFGGVAHHAPVLLQLSDVALGEGETFDQQLSASDLDGDPLTFFKSSGPSFMEVTTTDPGSGTATGRMILRPGFSDAGTAAGTVAVTDGGLVAQAAFTITVREVNRPPVLVQPRDMIVEEEDVAFQDLFATDPDGQPVYLSKVSGPGYMQVITGYGPRPFIEVWPRTGARSDSATVAASDHFLLDQKSFLITVKRLPSLTQPVDMVVRVNTTADQTLNATDADGDPLTFSRAFGPYFVRISTTDPGHGSASGLVHVTPGEFDVGLFETTVEVKDDLSSSVRATFRITVVNSVGGGLGARGLFTSRFISLDAGAGPSGAVLGDLNRDGLMDALVTNSDFYSGDVSVFFGIQGGTFADRVPVLRGPRPRSAQLGDFNGDRIEDLAVAINDVGGFVSVLMGRGDGTFLPRVDYPVGLNCAAIAVGDVNGDGYPDVAGASEGYVRVMLNRGDGVFGLPIDLPSRRFPIDMKLEDMNQDGALELIVAYYNENVEVFRGHGDGTFEGPTPVSSGAASLTVGDLNSDGYMDLVLANPGLGRISIFLGGSTGLGTSRQDFAAGSAPGATTIDDFNRDGRPDLAVTNSTSDSVTILFGDGTGGFVPSGGFGTGVGPAAIVSADLNLDGASDILTSNYGSGTIAIILANADGSFSGAGVFNASDHPAAAVPADFNRDGLMDLAVADHQESLISVLYGKTDGGLERVSSVQTGLAPRPIASGDLNRDGYPDLVTGNLDANSVSVILNHAGASFGPRTDVPVDRPQAVGLADLNGDGVLDLTVSGAFDYFQVGLSIMMGRGDGTFLERSEIPIRSNGITSLAIAKFDTDSTLDVVGVTSDGYSSYYVVLLGHGDGSFADGTFGYLDREYQQVIATDLNQDGKTDLAFTGYVFDPPVPSNGFVSVLLGNGDGTFGSPTGFETGYLPQALAAADFNADGRPDLAVANASGNTVSLLLGNGGGTFGTKVDFGVGRYPSGIVAADMDGDGKIDLVTCNQSGGTVTVLKNRGTAPPNRAPTADAGGPYSGVAGVPVAFSGLGSSDPEGSQLTFSWGFGDGAEATGPQPLHTYRGDGRFQVSLDVSDGSLGGRDTTSATISAALPGVAFLGDAHRVLPVGVGPPFTCIQVEPAQHSYENSEIIPSTIVLKSPGTGDVSEIHAIGTKDVRIWDRDRDGVAEIAACFGREDLHHLFSSVRGRTAVPVAVEGGLTTGARFRAPLEITVVGTGTSSYSIVSANPIKSRGTLTFLNPRPGPVKVQLFDAAGRLVRTIANWERAESGLIDVPLDGLSDSRARLPSGVYFYKICNVSGVTTGRLSILR